MSMTTRLIAVKYLPATSTKGSRLKVFICGSEPQTFGYHSFPGGSSCASQEAAEAALPVAYPQAKCATFVAVANPQASSAKPQGDGMRYFVARYLEA